MKDKLKKIFTLKNVSLFIKGLFLISIIVLFTILFKTKIIPTKYIVELLIILVLINLIFILVDIKFNRKKVLVIILDILSIIFIVILNFATVKLIETDSFFNKITSNNKVEISNYYVVINKDSNYEKLRDIKNKNIKILKSESNYKEVKEKLNSKVKINFDDEEELTNLGNYLLESKDNLIIISDANYDLLDENIENFKESTKILYTLSIESVLEDISKDKKVTKEPFNIYISGIDTYGKISTKARSDVNIIMTVNPVTKKILLTSIPRDYYVQLHGTTGYKDKLTHAGVYGINMSVQTIEDLLDIDINYYLRVNFNTLIDVVDELDGIEIYSDSSFTPWTNQSCKFQKGTQKVDGKCALAFARERHAYNSGDRHRGENQQQVITALINKATTSKKVITNYSNILNALDGSFQTNLSTEEIYALINMQIDDMASWSIESISLNGYDSSNYTYSYGSQKLYVMEPNYETVKTAQDKISEYME